MLTKFKINILLHLGAIVILVAAGVIFAQDASNYFLVGILLLVLVSLLYNLFRIVNATNRKLTDFLLNIKYDDYEAHYSSTTGEQTQKALSGAFNLITDKFRHVRQEKEAQSHFLNNLVENVETGLICFEDSGDTLLMNPALRKTLHKSYIPNLESLAKVDQKLHDAMVSMPPGEKTTVQVKTGQEMADLTIRRSTMKIGEKIYHLYALSDIRNELETQEIAAWQKLIRILTHEIMNSVTPVVSLASTADAMIVKESSMDPETRDEIHMAVRTIQKRSEGLLDFTEKYRSLTKLPTPRLEPVDLCELLDRCIILFGSRIQEQGVEVEKFYPQQEILVDADHALLEQALINLIKNALDALEGQSQGRLQLAVRRQPEGRTTIEIGDNGPGIPEDVREHIFVPFYTTKEKGSGIGLSLARQIVHLHKGSISCASEVGEGTLFTVVV